MNSSPSLDARMLYLADLSEPVHHTINVELWIKCGMVSSADGAVEIVFPVWTPGSYMVRDYTRNIESIVATSHPQLALAPRATGPDRSPGDLPLQRLGKNRWRIEGHLNGGWLRVAYRLYCREMSVRTNWIERDFGFLTGAATFPYVAGREREPIELRLHLPSGWSHVATALEQVEHDGDQVRLRASDFDQLVDAPLVCGNFDVRKFEVGGKSHFLVNVGGDQLWDLDRAVADTTTIVAAHQKFWRVTPYEHYWFLNLNTESRGGLEHDDSTVLMCSRWTMHRRESYLDWLALVSHEFFHTWNVRRLRPRALMEYDYEREQFLDELWIAEGVTSYFDDLALARTGLCSREEYLARLSKTIQTVQAAPGRLVQDLRDASWDAWTKHYRPDENSGNARISYYLKGALIAWLLDVQLRQLSDSRLALDDVMRQLWERHVETGYTLDDFERIVAELGGATLRDWLHAAVRQATELNFELALQWFGLQFRAEDSAKKSNFAKVWIGSQSTGSEGKLVVRNVLRGSPSDRAGLNVEDELLALDGYRLSPEIWPGHLEMFEPEQELELLVSRRGKIVPLRITLGKKPPHNWELAVDEAAAAESRQRRDAWLGRDDCLGQ